MNHWGPVASGMTSGLSRRFRGNVNVGEYSHLWKLNFCVDILFRHQMPHRSPTPSRAEHGCCRIQWTPDPDWRGNLSVTSQFFVTAPQDISKLTTFRRGPSSARTEWSLRPTSQKTPSRWNAEIMTLSSLPTTPLGPSAEPVRMIITMYLDNGKKIAGRSLFSI